VASFAHVAVGLLAGRLHGGGKQGRPSQSCSLGTLTFFTALALLPDSDVFLVALGAPDTGAIGHRGASHSFIFAVMIGLLCAFATRRLGWPAMRTALAGTLAVASHAVLDALGEGGRALPLLWPFSSERFASPWRIFPDAPRGLSFFTRAGVVAVIVEFTLFLPLMLYALWPRLPWVRRQPTLTLIEGGAAGVVPEPAAVPVPQPVVVDENGPPLRSNG
jgi:inner membrane protein